MIFFVLSALLVIALFCSYGVISSGKMKHAGDYALAGHSAGATVVSGVIMGTLVAGASTIGTVQLAYTTGLSAWWYTLGSGISCALLGLRFAGPVRRSGLSTLPEFIERNYGYPTALLTMMGSIAGTLLSVATQFIAGTALLRSILPLPQWFATLTISFMILSFIFMGGLKSFGAVSNVKSVLLYILLASCCFKASGMGFSVGRIARELPLSPWFNIFGRGLGKDLGAWLSLMTGILCTQIYMQAIFSASGESEARRGCLGAAFLIPPLGLMGVWTGLALRVSGASVEPAQALPHFINTYMPPAAAGAMWAVLAITVVGGASGLCLGVATNMSFDIFARLLGMERGDKRMLTVSRASVFLVVAAAALAGAALSDGNILQYSYLAMAVRGGGMVVPMLAAILRPGLLSPVGAFASSAAGFIGMIAAGIFIPSVEPLFIGLLLSVGVAAAAVKTKTFFMSHTG